MKIYTEIGSYYNREKCPFGESVFAYVDPNGIVIDDTLHTKSCKHVSLTAFTNERYYGHYATLREEFSLAWTSKTNSRQRRTQKLRIIKK